MKSIRLLSCFLLLPLGLAAGCGYDDDDGDGNNDAGGGLDGDDNTVPDGAEDPMDGSPTVSDWVVFSRRADDDGFDLYKVDVDGEGLAPLTMGRIGDELFASVSHDGTRIAFAGGKPGNPVLADVHFLTVADNMVTAAGTGLYHSTSPSFSPTDDRVVFEGRTTDAGKPDIYLIPAGGGTPVQLTTDAEIDAAPVWGPDGNTIYFVSKRTGRYDVWAMDANGENERAITTNTNLLGKAVVSPNGAYLLYAKATASQESRLNLFSLSTMTETQIADRNLSEGAFASDGRVIAAVSGLDIVLLDPDTGAEPDKLTMGPELDGAPSFAP